MPGCMCDTWAHQRSMVAHWLALLPHSKRLLSFAVWWLHVLPIACLSVPITERQARLMCLCGSKIFTCYMKANKIGKWWCRIQCHEVKERCLSWKCDVMCCGAWNKDLNVGRGITQKRVGGEQAESFKGQTATKEIKSKYYLLANQERGKK